MSPIAELEPHGSIVHTTYIIDFMLLSFQGLVIDCISHHRINFSEKLYFNMGATLIKESEIFTHVNLKVFFLRMI